MVVETIRNWGKKIFFLQIFEKYEAWAFKRTPSHPNWLKIHREPPLQTSPPKTKFSKNPKIMRIWNHTLDLKIFKNEILKKMQKFDFCKKCLRIILTMFEDKPFGLGIVWIYFGRLQASEHIFSPQRCIFWQKPTNEAKFSSKIPFLAWKNAIFDFWVKNTALQASKCISELGNRQNIPEII